MKLVNAIRGLWLMFVGIRVFNPVEEFRNKKIAIVGPADSAFEEDNGTYIDSFDFVIRVNKAAHSWNTEKARYIGTKTDILYHSFFENNKSGGGPLNLGLFKKLNIQYLINPRTNISSYRRTFNFFRKYRTKTLVYHLPFSFYRRMLKSFGRLRPTVGFTALYSALNSDCDTLYITGFTFFKTPYSDGYRDHLQDMNKNIEHIKAQGIHDVELEFELFKNNIKNTTCKNLILDRKLQEILAS